MKVKNLIEALQDYKPDEEIIVLWWTKAEDLSEEAWSKICAEFDEWEQGGADITEWVADAVIEYSTEE